MSKKITQEEWDLRRFSIHKDKFLCIENFEFKDGFKRTLNYSQELLDSNA